ncbi:hypothetical protein [Enterobacter sp. C4G1]|uniref:hypothetical protein n=1 Tax=Enterobacter sp. C4G1 TaxID=3458724 RepID=UPI004068B2D0
MMKHIGLVFFSSLLLVGCAQDNPLYRGFSSPDVDSTITTTPDMLMQILLSPPAAPEGTTKTADVSYRDPIVSKTCANAGTAVDHEKTCQAQRNDAIYILMTGSEQVCLLHRRSIYGNDAMFNISTGTLTSLFAGVATVVTPTVSKSIFSALAMFSNSERSLVNEVVYKQMIVTAVDTKIQQTRGTKAVAIVQHLKTDTMKDYPLSRALNDFMAYHNSCSFMEGLRLALANGTQNPTENKINTLNNRMLLNNAQMNIYCSGRKTTDTEMCESLKSRNTAITNELKTLEVQ